MLTIVQRLKNLSTIDISHIDTTEDALTFLGKTDEDWAIVYLSEERLPVIMFTRITGDEPGQVPTLIHVRGLDPHQAVIIVTRLDDGTRTFWQVSKNDEPEQLMFY